MFNMTKIKAVRGDGRSFYMNHLSSNDYYSEHEKVIGHWRGELAGDFGLWARNAESDEFCPFQSYDWRKIDEADSDRRNQVL